MSDIVARYGLRLIGWNGLNGRGHSIELEELDFKRLTIPIDGEHGSDVVSLEPVLRQVCCQYGSRVCEAPK